MGADPFSDFLNLVSAKSVIAGALVAGGSWAMSVPKPDKIKFWGVLRGECWLLLEGQHVPVRLGAGDVFLLARPCSLIMGSDLDAPRVRLDDVLKSSVKGIARHGTGDDCYLIGGNVELDPEYDQLVLDALPPSIYVESGSRRAQTLYWLMDQLIQEQEDSPPGADAVSLQIAQLMFIQILRAHFDGSHPLGVGWLRAVSDKRLAPALRLIHDEPGRPWQLNDLASAAAMSRASFALYFKSVAGIAPMAYLTAWRMRLAEHALRKGNTHIGTLRRSLGYASDAAFSNAFKRVTGRSPSKFKKSDLR